MREIKFRAWNKITKKFVSEGGIHFIARPKGIKFSEGDNLEYIQFTGLKDKNGKEIYEGDIIIDEYGDNKPSKPFIVGFMFGSFNIFEDEEDLKNEEYSEYYKNFVDLYHGGRIKVIGNKFENPKLLK